MDKSLLYKLPKDILVELVCKNFDSMSVVDVGKIYWDKYLAKLESYKKILGKSYKVQDFLIEYDRGLIYIKDSKDFYAAFYIDNLVMVNGNHSSAFSHIDMVFDQLRCILLIDVQDLDEIISVLTVLVKTHDEKKEIEKYMKSLKIDLKK